MEFDTWERTNDPDYNHKVKVFCLDTSLRDFIEEEKKGKITPIKISGIGKNAFVLEYIENTKNTNNSD